jgi:DNA (cytosine-5)-methyltransferase 1
VITYNEIDPYAADWTENLVREGLIAPGRVDRRSITDLTLADVKDLTQFHTFAGIGVWSYALRLAGWPDSAPVWTGSCPCQPFSIAGKGGGVDDERHLWPDWFKLIEQRKPSAIFGEQVASKPGLAWLDSVCADLEGAGYAFGAADLASAGAGAPHIRQRLYFCAFRMANDIRNGWTRRGGDGGGVENEGGRGYRPGVDSGAGGLADDDDDGREVLGQQGLSPDRDASFGHDADGRSATGGLVDTSSSRGEWNPGAISGTEGSAERRVRGLADLVVPAGPAGGLGHHHHHHHHHQGLPPRERETVVGAWGREEGRAVEQPSGSLGAPDRVFARDADWIGAAGATRGFWAGADWLPCRDGKWRPVEPGTFPLAHGAPARVGRLRAYGNAINAHLAAQFIRSSVEAFRLCM